MFSRMASSMNTITRTGARQLSKTTGSMYAALEALVNSTVLADECNIAIRIGFRTKFVLYRNRECSIPKPPPPPEPPENYNDAIQIPDGVSNLYVIVPTVSKYYEQGRARGTPPQAWAEEFTLINIQEFQSPYVGNVRIPHKFSPSYLITPEFYIKYETRKFFSYNGVYFAAFLAGNDPYTQIELMKARGYSVQNIDGIFGINSTYTITSIVVKEFYGQEDDRVIDQVMPIIRSKEVLIATINGNPSLYRNRRTTTREGLSYGTYTPGMMPLPVPGKYPGYIPLLQIINDFYGTYYTGYAEGLRVTQDERNFIILDGDYTPPIGKQPPPMPNAEAGDCCQRLEQLLQLTLKRIGANNFPANVPNSLTKKNSGSRQINSLSEYIAYTIKQVDAISGKYPIEIKIKDSDLTQEGDQSKTLTIPNAAEGIAEMIGILLVLQSESNANLIATISAMTEAGSAKQLALLAGDYAKANSEYLGYKGKQLERDVPFSFKPGESKLDKILVAGNRKVKGFENDDKEDLNDLLAPLLEMAAMWKAQNQRNLGGADPLTALKKIFNDSLNLDKGLEDLTKTAPPPDPNNPQNPQEPRKSDFDAFCEDAEMGFINQPGITDPVKPYGRPLDQRPKIREIGNDTSDTED